MHALRQIDYLKVCGEAPDDLGRLLGGEPAKGSFDLSSAALPALPTPNRRVAGRLDTLEQLVSALFSNDFSDEIPE